MHAVWWCCQTPNVRRLFHDVRTQVSIIPPDLDGSGLVIISGAVEFMEIGQFEIAVVGLAL